MPRPTNKELGRDEKTYLTYTELEKVIKVTTGMERAIVLLMARHGLRVGELVKLELKHLDISNSRLYIPRLKNSISNWHPMKGDELRIVRTLIKTTPNTFLFNSERKTPYSTRGIQHLIKNLGDRAGLPYTLHAHMFRHTCGFLMASAGVNPLSIKEWLGHKDIANTMIYVEAAAKNLENLPDWWK